MKILITDPITETGKRILQEAGFEIIDLPNGNKGTLDSILPYIDGWIVRSGSRVTESQLKKTDNLKVIGRAGVGVDNIDLSAATLHGVVVMNTPDANTISAAEHTIALILSLVRNVYRGYTTLRAGNWERNQLIGIELRGKTLGVIGLGKIGTEVIKRLYPFGMKILGYDPYVSPERYELDCVEFVSLKILCEKSDIITIHVPKTADTIGMFNLNMLQRMKDSAYIINCARGGIIDENDLKIALEKRLIAGAAVDVFENEPPQNSPLLSIPNLLYTPHLGASTREAKESVSTSICTQVRDYLLNGTLSNALNIPIADPSLLLTLKPYLHLAEILGSMQQQLANSPVQSISITTEGSLKETKLVTLAFLKGYLEKIHGTRVNYINATMVTESHGIQVEEIYRHGDADYANVISSTVKTSEKSLTIKASLFADNHPRIIYFDGFHLDLKPSGNLLIVHNNDVPGVVGRVGTHLAKYKINIAEYQLGREKGSHHAIGIIRIDTPLNQKAIGEMIKMQNILSVQQVIV